MPTVNKQSGFITQEEYLQGELSSEVKHEYIAGQVIAMTGASDNHDYISGNIFAEFRSYLKNSDCRPFTSDKKLKTSNGNFRYPDCMVVCDNKFEDKYYKTKPVILLKVISRSTRKIDEHDKRMEYINILTLLEYVTIEQDFVKIIVSRKNDNWHSAHYFLGDEIYFESIDLTLSVEEIYFRVENEDMVEFLANKKTGGI